MRAQTLWSIAALTGRGGNADQARSIEERADRATREADRRKTDYAAQLDTDALFYLRSRALDEQAARDLLTYAFANDVLSRMKLAAIRLPLEQRLTTRLLRGRSLSELELI